MTPDQKKESLDHLAGFASALEDCEALVVIHVNRNGDLRYYRNGNPFTQVGALQTVTHDTQRDLALMLANQPKDPR